MLTEESNLKNEPSVEVWTFISR